MADAKDLRRRSGNLVHQTTAEEIRTHYPIFTQLLNKREEEISARRESARKNLDEQVMTAPGDEGDLSVIDNSADYFVNLAHGFHNELVEIRDAFERMHRGVFGMCASCEEPISMERLQRLPYARFCVDCQSTQEKGNVVAFPRARPKL